jgi:hypothetical protein
MVGSPKMSGMDAVKTAVAAFEKKFSQPHITQREDRFSFLSIRYKAKRINEKQ